MTFEPENIPSFERIFKASSDRIRAFGGCRKVELLQDIHDPAVFFTYSIWDSEDDLDAYRKSEFFRQVWGETRALFARRAKAWSLHKADAE